MKKIKIKFVDFWSNFNYENNFITQILEKKYDIEISDNPDYLFYATHGDSFINYNCIRIFITGENLCPDFNFCDYAIGFEKLQFNDRYLRCPFYILLPEYQKDVNLALKKNDIEGLNILKKKSGFCSFVYSNADADPFRGKLFEAINSYKTVNAGGKVFNNIGKKVEDKISFEALHKFSIACENSQHDGYTTEKIVQSFAAQTIPIYWGNSEVQQDFNEKAFINCSVFGSLDELVKKIKEIDENDELYLSMLREPAFASSFDVDRKKQEFEEFLFHIFSQEYNLAYRRNTVYWGEKYENRYKKYRDFYRIKIFFYNLLTLSSLRRILGDYKNEKK